MTNEGKVRAMPLGIVIPTDTSEPMYSRNFDGLADYQEVIGGLIEGVELTDPTQACLYVDEEGLLKQREWNSRATLLLMVHNPRFMFHGTMILGPAIIVGPADDEGDTLDAPEEFVALMLSTPTYKVEVQTMDDPNAWNGNQRRFTAIEEAYEHGVNLAHKWTAVERVRISPA